MIIYAILIYSLYVDEPCLKYIAVMYWSNKRTWYKIMLKVHESFIYEFEDSDLIDKS